ncbi:hypothetical protein INR49_018998 [Caranx melampygus]|nr:hypothetical protein INR49_018998 [Caranx melampygus]
MSSLSFDSRVNLQRKANVHANVENAWNEEEVWRVEIFVVALALPVCVILGKVLMLLPCVATDVARIKPKKSSGCRCVFHGCSSTSGLGPQLLQLQQQLLGTGPAAGLPAPAAAQQSAPPPAQLRPEPRMVLDRRPQVLQRAAEVHDLADVLPGHQHVGGFDVQVHDAVRVEEPEPVQDVDGVPEPAVPL